MDVYISLEAYKMLSTFSFVLSEFNANGLLLGHKRGHRFFVEKIFPTCKGFFSSLDSYLDIEKKYGDKILGFFTLGNEEGKTKKILVPYAYGKIFLEITPNKKKNLSFKSYIIDYDNKFFLSYIPLKLSKGIENNGKNPE